MKFLGLPEGRTYDDLDAEDTTPETEEASRGLQEVRATRSPSRPVTTARPSLTSPWVQLLSR